MLVYALKIIAEGDFTVCENRKFKVTGTGNDFWTRKTVLQWEAKHVAREQVTINSSKYLLPRAGFLKTAYGPSSDMYILVLYLCLVS